MMRLGPHPDFVAKTDAAPKEHHGDGAVHVIALTGGPCGGKSSALMEIQKAMRSKGVDVYLVPEVATLFFMGGCEYPGFDAGQKLVELETAIVQLQMQIERSFLRVAQSTGRPGLLVCDRGVLDNGAYIPRADWLSLLAANAVTEEGLISHYDGIVHLVSCADGAEEHYKWGHVKDDQGNAVYRKESPGEARELDRNTLACWTQHPRLGTIKNLDDGFKGKIQRATEYVLQLMEQPATSAIKLGPGATSGGL